MSFSPITNIVERMKEAFLPEWRNGSNALLLLEIFGEEMQLVEDVICQLIVDRVLTAAEGVNLDQYGELVDLERLGRTDDEYRLAIQAKIKANTRGHLAAQVGEIASVLLKSDTIKARYLSGGGAYFQVEYTPDSPLSPEHLGQAVMILQDMAPAGVLLGLVTEATADAFCFDSGGLGFDDGELAKVAGT